MKYFLALIFFLSQLFIFSCTDPADLDPNISEIQNIHDPDGIYAIMDLIVRWQVNNPDPENANNGMAWARSTFYIGLLEAYKATKDPHFLYETIFWAKRKEWKLDQRIDISDDHAAGQVYLDLYLLDPEYGKIDHTQERFEVLMNTYHKGRELYWWADALFMSPPVCAKLYSATSDPRYLDYLHEMWWDAVDYLIDEEYSLFYRDQWAFNKRTPSGKKVFWSRGNGWVVAGLIRVIDHLPSEDKFRNTYIDLFKKMSESLVMLQLSNGYWYPSLLDSTHIPFPESSGTAFFTYALSWGINHDYLDKGKYMPSVEKSWQALVQSIHLNGKLGWVQPGGSKPDTVTYLDHQEFGTGAFLLAAAEYHKLRSE